MIKIIVISLFLLSSFAHAYQWPIAGGYLTASFGDVDSNFFLKGVRVVGHSSVVSPFLDGEIIYYTDEESDLYSVHGNMKVLNHDNGFRSIYCNLEKSYKEVDDFFVEKDDQIGIVGNSGRSIEKGLYFLIYDTQKNQYLNPQLFLPPSGDLIPPEILDVYLLKDNEKIELSSSAVLSSGQVKIIAEVYDLEGIGDRSIKIMPYSISVFYLGNEVNLIKFDTLRINKGILTVEGGRPFAFNNLFTDSNEMILGELNLTSGSANLEISATDISGNNSTRMFQLNIE